MGNYNGPLKAVDCRTRSCCHAISNGFVFGSISANIIANDEVTEEMCAILSPVRPFGFIFAYTAGAHRVIRGHFSFFEVDLTHTGTVMN
eukprot:scaffold31_cov98-Skeletonema_dohrnii-CCMP3373.AAC.4